MAPPATSENLPTELPITDCAGPKPLHARRHALTPASRCRRTATSKPRFRLIRSWPATDCV